MFDLVNYYSGSDANSRIRLFPFLVVQRGIFVEYNNEREISNEAL